MTDRRTAALQYAHEQRERFLQELIDFSSIASISTDPEAKPQMKVAARWVAEQLLRLGLDNVQVYETKGHPVVFGESLQAGPAAPTALIYGHYDVQPPEPLELWVSGPFEPTVRGDHLYGRGVSDMKGQVAVALDAVEALMRTSSLPINVKFLIEGEEEIGSPSLPEFINSHKDLLRADFAINPDTGMISPDAPAITYALRGLAFFELRVFGPDHDLHSGTFGGVVDNPAKVLCELIAGMHDDHGRVTLPGFYDKVRPIGPEERAELKRLPMDETYYLMATGAPALRGESGYIPAEQTGARPTLEINGLLSGYTAAGAKTVLPARAMAKISMRLVPDQDPAEVQSQLRAYLEACAPPTVRWEIDDLTGGPASISDISSDAVQALSQALETVWGTRPLFKREGGSVPVVAQFQKLLGIESVNTGFSFPDDNAHSPNEKLHLPTWHRGIDTFIHYFLNLTGEA